MPLPRHETKRMRLKDLRPADYNPRRMPAEQAARLREGLERWGQVQSIVWNKRTGNIVGGHQRVEALEAIAEKEADVTIVDLDPVDERLLNVALNKVHGEWDEQRLVPLLQELKVTASDLLHLTGYGGQELADLLGTKVVPAPGGTVTPDVPPVPKNPVTKPGDVLVLGKHRVICGDSTDPAVVRHVLGKERIHLTVTDPPWNVAYGSSKDHPSWRPRTVINDNLGDAFPAFIDAAFRTLAGFTRPGAALYCVMSAQEWPTIDRSLRGLGWHWSSTIIWAKDAHVLSRKDYHTQYEPIWYGWHSDAPRLHPLESRTESDLWSIPRPRQSEEHPTMKPVPLFARAIQNSSFEGDVVWDGFLGSGTTLLAAEQLNRRFVGAEIDPGYCDVIAARFTDLTGQAVERVPAGPLPTT